MLHRRGKLTVNEDRGYFVDLDDGKSKRTYELNPDRVVRARGMVRISAQEIVT